MGVCTENRLLPRTLEERLELHIATLLLHRGAGRHAGLLPVFQIVQPDLGVDTYPRVDYAPEVVQSLNLSPRPGSVEEFFDLMVETLQVRGFVALMVKS